jgi:hypothetical protein
MLVTPANHTHPCFKAEYLSWNFIICIEYQNKGLSQSGWSLGKLGVGGG